MATNAGAVLLLALLLLYQEKSHGKKANEAGQSSGNTASTSGRGHWSGLGEYGGTMELRNDAVVHLPGDGNDGDYWNMRTGDVDRYAKMFANVWEDNIRKMAGDPREKLTVDSCEIVLSVFKVNGKSVKETGKEKTRGWVKVVEKDWKFCAEMKIQKKKSAGDNCPKSKSTVCVQARNEFKMAYQALFDLTLNQTREESIDLHNNVEIVVVKGDPQLKEKWKPVARKVMMTMMERWLMQTVFVIKVIDAEMRKPTVKHENTDAAGEDTVEVKVISWVDLTK